MPRSPLPSPLQPIPSLPRRGLLHLAGASGLTALLAACGKRGPRAHAVPSGASVLALGDSLTAGVGADAATSYPSVLAGLTGWKLVNAGVSGDTSAQALERLPALLAQHMPSLVLVCIGGNDFLRSVPEAQTRAQVHDICTQAKASGAQVLLIGVPRPNALAAATGRLHDHVLYADVAEELKLPLFSDGWGQVLGDPALRADQVHANAQGYRAFAQALYTDLQDRGLVDA